MLKGFRDFILRGNIIDLAIAVIIGVAFNAVVTSLTNDFLKPLIGLAGGGGTKGGKFTVHGQVFEWADFINAVINFVLIAAVLYFIVVVPMNKINEMRRRGKEPVEAPAPPTDEAVLLTEIRDLLAASAGRTVAPAPRTDGGDVTDRDAMPPRS
ncbi:MAG TPA: large conductance mechanosensitive channel protein MscL [Micromonosporaceae bacterium]|jgi:large conductance mechanosensitive channel